VIFVFRSIVAGLAIAFVAVIAKPELLTGPAYGRRAAPASILSSPSMPAAATSYAQAVEAAAPAVVNIHTHKFVKQRSNPLLDDPLFRRFFGDNVTTDERPRETSLGSGVIVSRDGYVLTNHHVIDSADEIMVYLRDGSLVDATVIGSDLESDIAVLQLAPGNYAAIDIGNSDEVKIGDVVLAIGNPFGVGQTVTQGIISATGRNQGINRFQNFIQTDAAVNPGNSGGALVNARGELIGVNTAIVSKTGGSEGISFAVPANTAMKAINDLITTGVVVRGWLGIQVNELSAELAAQLGLPMPKGVMVERVQNGGPAHAAGILPGDVVTHIVGEPITDTSQAVNLISNFDPGTRIHLTIIRDGAPLTLHARVSERPRLAKR
jgi:serine protease DegS